MGITNDLLELCSFYKPLPGLDKCLQCENISEFSLPSPPFGKSQDCESSRILWNNLEEYHHHAARLETTIPVLTRPLGKSQDGSSNIDNIATLLTSNPISVKNSF